MYPDAPKEIVEQDEIDMEIDKTIFSIEDNQRRKSKASKLVLFIIIKKNLRIYSIVF